MSSNLYTDYQKINGTHTTISYFCKPCNLTLFYAETCPKPDPIGNGSFINLPEVHYLGDIVAPRCNFGFEMVVGGSLTCGENGRWEGYFPYCLCEHVFDSISL